MDENADLLAAALDDDATAELFDEAPAAIDPDVPDPRPTAARLASACAASTFTSPAPIPTPIAAPEAPGALEPAPGVVLRQRYVLDQPLAAGGTAVIYRARDLRRDGGLIALKFLRPETRDRPQAAESLRREFQHAQALSHPNIARVFDLDCDSGLWFLTLELLDGESLAALLKRGGEPLAPRRALDILRACGEALSFAHERGVVHGDFKPGNVFITRTGQVRVLDFGAAVASSRVGDARIAMATPPYASPQVLAGERPERRDDVFSFACVAYELLSGRHPFGRRSSLEARAANAELARAWNLSPQQWHTLEAALSWEREQRPATLRALLTELASSEVPPALVIPEISVEARTYRPPALVSLSSVLTLAVLGVSALVLAYTRLDDRPNIVEPATAGALAARLPAGETPRSEERVRSAAAPPAAAIERPAEKKPTRAESVVAPAADAARAPESASGAAWRTPTLPALVSLDPPSVLVSEGAVAAVLRLNRVQRLAGRVQVKWRTQSGSALPGSDFTPIASGTADFADGQMTRAIYIPLLDDKLVERDETLTVELVSTGDGARIHPTARAQITIRDDD